MLKMALFDCAINEKCYSVVPTPGDLTAQEYPPGEFAIQGKKNANAKGASRGEGLGAGGIDCYRYRCWRIR